MNFVWFWTFWHWSREGYRDGSLLLNPLHGIGSHWDEWFRHEASENELRSVEVAGRTKSNQRRFIAWLLSRWATEADLGGKRLARRFVLVRQRDAQYLLPGGHFQWVASAREWSGFVHAKHLQFAFGSSLFGLN